MARTLEISDSFYNLISYGAKTYGVSRKEFCDMLNESHLSLIKVKCNFIQLEKRFKQLKELNTQFLIEKGRNTYLEMKKSENSAISVSMIKEGLKLIEDVNPEKAKELREQLKELKEQRLQQES